MPHFRPLIPLQEGWMNRLRTCFSPTGFKALEINPALVLGFPSCSINPKLVAASLAPEMALECHQENKDGTPKSPSGASATLCVHLC